MSRYSLQDAAESYSESDQYDNDSDAWDLAVASGEIDSSATDYGESKECEQAIWNYYEYMLDVRAGV